MRPQREALEALLCWATAEAELEGGQTLLHQRDLMRVRESKFRLSSLVAELEANADSGTVLQDELVALASEQIAASDHSIAKVGLVLSAIVLVDLSIEISQFAHFLGFINLHDLAGTFK